MKSRKKRPVPARGTSSAQCGIDDRPPGFVQVDRPVEVSVGNVVMEKENI